MTHLDAGLAPLRPGHDARQDRATFRAALEDAQGAVDEVYAEPGVGFGPPVRFEPEYTPRALAANRTKRALRRAQRAAHGGRS